MKYKLNNEVFRNIFGVPCAVADNYIKLASHSALKTLLFIMRNGVGAIDDSTTFKLGITRTELDEALMYWSSVGILCDGEEAVSGETPLAVKDKAVATQLKPSRAESARRVGESREIAQTLRSAEQVFGRTLKQAEISTLVYIMDSLMLSPPVVLMLIQYAAAQERLNASFLEATAVRWINEGLTSVREVEKEIQKANEIRTAWGIVRTAFGIDKRRPSKNEEQFAFTWVNEWGFSPAMLRMAYDECIDHSGKLSMPYINKILSAWHSGGITSPEQADTAKQKRTEKKAADKKGETPSFDLSLFEQMMGGE